MQRWTFEIVQRGTKSVSVRGVWAPFNSRDVRASTDAIRVPVPGDVPLGEPELWELRNAIEQEIRGWAAKLPLGYE